MSTPGHDELPDARGNLSHAGGELSDAGGELSDARGELSDARGDEPRGGTRVAVRLPADLPGALAAIGHALDFPEYYGRNLDALLDCLRDLEGEVALQLEGWQELAWRDPQGWARLRAVLDQRTAEGGHRANPAFGPVPAFTVLRS